MPDLEKTTKTPDADGSFELTRLEDIDPEFVSLVPRGANKHSKMLVVKSDDPAAALAAFRKDADATAPGTAAIYAHLVGAALDAGADHSYDPSDALDALLPAALVGRLRKDDAGAPPPEAPPAPAAPPFGAWLAGAREQVAARLLEAVLAAPAVVAPPVAKAAPAADPAVELAKAEAVALRAEVGRLRAAIGSATTLPAGEVAAPVTPAGAPRIPWTADFAAIAASQEK